jgi:hypothetical protein
LAKDQDKEVQGQPFQELRDAIDEAVAEMTQLIGSVQLDLEQMLNEAIAAVHDLLDDIQNQLDDIQAQLGAEEAARIAADTAEAGARLAGDQTLQDNLDAEEAARIAADTAEAGARLAGDQTLQDNLDAEEAARVAADTAEAGARLAGDQTLQDNLDAEEAARVAAGTAEAGARLAGDQTLQDNLDAEEAARIAADNNLQGQIDTIELTPGPEGPQGPAGSNMIIAMGTVDDDGTLLQAYNVTSVTWTDYDWRIELTGIEYDEPDYVTIVTAIYPGINYAGFYGNGDALYVRVFGHDGTTKESGFSFVVLDVP